MKHALFSRTGSLHCTKGVVVYDMYVHLLYVNLSITRTRLTGLYNHKPTVEQL